MSTAASLSALELTYLRDVGHLVTPTLPRQYPPDSPPKPTTYPERVLRAHQEFCLPQEIARVNCQICRDNAIQQQVEKHLASYQLVSNDQPSKENGRSQESNVVRERCRRLHRDFESAAPTCVFCHGTGYVEACLARGEEPEPETSTAQAPAQKSAIQFSHHGQITYIGSFECEERTYAKHIAAVILGFTESKYYRPLRTTLTDERKQAVEREVKRVLATKVKRAAFPSE